MPKAIAGLHRDLELPSAVALIASGLLFSDCSTLHDGAVGNTWGEGEGEGEGEGAVEHDRSSSPGTFQAQAQALDKATRQKRKTAVLHAIARGLQAMSGSSTALDIKDLSTASLPDSEGSKDSDSIMYASIPAYYNPGDTAGPYFNSGASRRHYSWGRSSGPLKTLVGHTINCLRKGVLPTDTNTEGTTDATGNTTIGRTMTEDQKRAVEAYQTTFDQLLSTPGRRNGLMLGRDDVIYQTALPILLASHSDSVPVSQELIDRLNIELAQSKAKREADGAARGARPRPGGPNGAGVKSFC